MVIGTKLAALVLAGLVVTCVSHGAFVLKIKTPLSAVRTTQLSPRIMNVYHV